MGICFAASKSIVPPDIWISGQRFGWRVDGIPKAAGRLKQLLKNLPRGRCRKSQGEDF
jgi:hypothetical protein